MMPCPPHPPVTLSWGSTWGGVFRRVPPAPPQHRCPGRFRAKELSTAFSHFPECVPNLPRPQLNNFLPGLHVVGGEWLGLALLPGGDGRVVWPLGGGSGVLWWALCPFSFPPPSSSLLPPSLPGDGQPQESSSRGHTFLCDEAKYFVFERITERIVPAVNFHRVGRGSTGTRGHRRGGGPGSGIQRRKSAMLRTLTGDNTQTDSSRMPGVAFHAATWIHPGRLCGLSPWWGPGTPAFS